MVKNIIFWRMRNRAYFSCFFLLSRLRIKLDYRMQRHEPIEHYVVRIEEWMPVDANRSPKNGSMNLCLCHMRIFRLFA